MASFYEFFAGGGMARAGLGPRWTCLFANDFDENKGASYANNWGADTLKIGDVAKLKTSSLPGIADLAWASFPCQDLSLAGAGVGLNGERSGTFWPFWKLIKALSSEDRSPPVVVLENVCGALTSHEGKDFAAIAAALVDSGYSFGALVVDAVHFVPQSRPRLFMVGVREGFRIPPQYTSAELDPFWHTAGLITAHKNLAPRVKREWIWWRLPIPAPRKTVFADLIEDEPRGVTWHTASETRCLLQMMSELNRRKVEQAKRTGRRIVGGIYKRTRVDSNGERVQRAEIRFDDIAGCLRTPTGGSSRQSIMIVEGNKVRSRLLSPREAARLMGLPDKYKLPDNYNEAYHLAGDGVAVPVVRFLAAHLLEPLLSAQKQHDKKAA